MHRRSLYDNAVRATPLYGKYMKQSGHVWVDRTDESQWRPQVAGAAALVRAGACHPGEPRGHPQLGRAPAPDEARGLPLLARAAGRPIVCATLLGARDSLPRGALAVRPGRVRVLLSRAIPAPPGGAPDLEAQVAATFERTLAAG